MEQRDATNPEHMKGMDTAELRDRDLVQELFVADSVTAIYTHHDRIVAAGVMPVSGPLTLSGYPEIRSKHVFEHREAGIVDVGGTGSVTVDGETYEMASGACLCIGRGASDPEFTSADADAPAQDYVFSAPAHTAYPTTLVEPGDGLTSNRRTELYLCFDRPEDAAIVHLMGTPQETRHLMVHDREVIISPSWSMHAGVGTASYSFVWAMAGENQDFTDMDGHPVTTLL